MDAPPVQYVTTRDGYNIAYAVSGQGRPFVMMPLAFSHIQLYWAQDTFVRPWLEGLMARFQLIQYDGRGQGMSTRGMPEEFSSEVLGLDLEAVVEHLTLDRFVLHATGLQDATALRFGVAHPDRVEALVLASPQFSTARSTRSAFDVLAAEDWELFLRSTIPAGLSPDQIREAVDRVKQTWTQQDYLTVQTARTRARFDDALPRLRVPTLVLHPRDYVLSSRPEDSMQLTARVANARFVMLEGGTILGDPLQGLKAIDDFLTSLPPREEHPPAVSSSSPASLSPREIEVLRLVAIGRSNQQIADVLTISQNTVIRHVSNIFAKTNAANRTEAAAFAREQGLL